MAFADELEAFKHSLGYLESRNNYDATGPYTGARYGRAKGRYQIMSAIYPAWAKEAGVDPADYSPAAQERVATKKMTDYYRQFGSWDLVAVAWFAGPGRAAQAKKKGIASVGGLKDMLGTSVATYAEKVMSGMSRRPVNPTQADHQANERRRPVNPRQADHLAGVRAGSRTWATGPDESGMGAPTGGGVSTLSATEPVMTPMEEQTQADQINSDGFAQILSSISAAASSRGGQILDLKNFLGLPEPEQPISTVEPPAPAEAAQQPQETEAAPVADGPMAPPPKHKGFAGLTDTAKVGSQQLLGAFPGLRFTSGLRDPAHNASVGGVKNSKHLTGQASDFAGSKEEMARAAEWAKARGAKVLVHDSGSGLHLHIEWP